MQKARGQSDDGRSRPPSSHRLSAHGFRISFTRHLACFSPFPHGTGSLSVAREYLALEGGPPSFLPDFTCPAVLGWSSRSRCSFAYGAFTLSGRPFQAVLLPQRFVTSSRVCGPE